MIVNEKDSLSKKIFSMLIFGILFFILIISTGEMIHGKMLRVGEKIFGDAQNGIQYFLLRGDIEKPDCDPNPNIDQLVQQKLAEQKNTPKSDLDSIFGDSAVDTPESIRISLEASQKNCQEKFRIYERTNQMKTPMLKMYRSIEMGFYAFFKKGLENRRWVLLFLIACCAVYATLKREHIGIFPVRSRLDYRVSSILQSLAHAILLYSCYSHYHVQKTSGVGVTDFHIHVTWMMLWAILLGLSLYQSIRIPVGVPTGSRNVLKAFLSTPLYALMTLTSSLTFILHENYAAGIAVYLNSILENAGIFISLCLYIWAGMILRQTILVDKFMDIIRPFRLSPELQMFVILVLAAIPTAYTGGSGIFILAAGAIIYYEVLQAGARPQLALAAVAMSGSLGVVLRPCLLILIITLLNRDVTTDQLYGWGTKVFLLTSFVMLMFALLVRRKGEQRSVRPQGENMVQQVFMNTWPVMPYILAGFAVWCVYYYLLDTKMDEINAPIVLPVMLLTFLFIEKKFMWKETLNKIKSHVQPTRIGFRSSAYEASSESALHIGALITLFMLSLVAGGAIERSHIVNELAPHLTDPWLGMLVLVLILVVCGNIMDPIGAIILLSGTLPAIANEAGISSLHFWMVALVAFELAYLIPPVALNQLIARHVVGDEAMERIDREAQTEKSFYYRHERWIFPIVVMFTTLMIVAFGPLVVQSLGG